MSPPFDINNKFKMTSRQDQRDMYQDLLEQLADIERQQEDNTLSHSDQQLLDQAWEDITRQIEDFEELFEQQDEHDEADWRDAEEFFADEEEEERRRIEGKEEDDDVPPSVTVRAGFTVKGGKVKVVTFAPPPPAAAGADEPRPRSPELLMPSEEDNRSGCEHCGGCTYCYEGMGYDHGGEI